MKKRNSSPRAELSIRDSDEMRFGWSSLPGLSSSASLLFTVGLLSMLAITVGCRKPISTENRLVATVPQLNVAPDQEIDPAIERLVKQARQDVLEQPESADLWGHLGMVFAAHSFESQAIACFAEAARLAPQNQKWAYLHARWVVTVSPEESLELLKQCAELPGDPTDTARLVLVEGLLEQSQLDEAEQHLKRSLTQNPQNVRARFTQARLLSIRGDYEGCKNQILETHREIKATYEAEVERAKRFERDGRQAEARGTLERAGQQLRASLCQQKTIGNLLATALMRTGDVEAGQKQQQLADQQTDTNWSDPYTRGMAQLKTGLKALLSKSDVAHSEERYADSLAVLERAVSEYPDSLFARVYLGRTHIRLGRRAQQSKDSALALSHYQDAQRHLDVAVELDANSVEAHFRRGILERYWASLEKSSERLGKAEQSFRKAISIKPDFSMAYYNLARCLDRQQRPLEAIEAMREALAFEPNDLMVRKGLGGLLMKAGKLEEAINQLEQVAKKRPEDKQVQGWLALMRQDLNSK
ncbi:MAG: tetratricopeptide repeat protein [Pirellulaceae bacterium]|nr:tetratricopeptide repeat protein [Pirellulaceae bacterium]